MVLREIAARDWDVACESKRVGRCYSCQREPSSDGEGKLSEFGKLNMDVERKAPIDPTSGLGNTQNAGTIRANCPS